MTNQTQGRFLLWVLWIWYLAGALWFQIGMFRSVMPLLSSLSLFFVFGLAILLVATPAFGARTGAFLAGVVAVAGFLLELVGVTTGVPFGVYHYGMSLPGKLFDVPLAIGAAWGGISLLCWNLSSELFHKPALRILGTGAIATLFDAVMEPAAQKLGFWHWEGGAPPFQNFLTWFVFSALIALVFERFRTEEGSYSRAAHHLLGAQFLFFGACLL